MKNILVFASGTPVDGGVLFESVANAVSENVIKDARMTAVVSNFPHGGIFHKAVKNSVKFHHFKGPNDIGHYQEIYQEYEPDLIVLAGWRLKIYGHDFTKTISTIPALLPWFGGPGMYGNVVHQKVCQTLLKTREKSGYTGLTIHFVDDEYCHGPVIMQIPVLISSLDTADTISLKVKVQEQFYLPLIISAIFRNEVHWSGSSSDSVVLPEMIASINQNTSLIVRPIYDPIFSSSARS